MSSLTGIPAVQGDVAVAALDSELVELYRARPELGNEGSLRDSDETEKKQITKHILNINFTQIRLIRMQVFSQSSIIIPSIT